MKSAIVLIVIAALSNNVSATDQDIERFDCKPTIEVTIPTPEDKLILTTLEATEQVMIANRQLRESIEQLKTGD